VVFRFSCCLSFSCGNSFSHLLDLSYGFQMYGDGFSCNIQLIRELLLSMSVILIQQCLQFAVFKLFRWFSTFFISHVKIATFEFFKSLKALWFTKSMLTVSFDKHSMRFCSSFLQMVTENQCCSQIVVSSTKFDMFNAITNYTVVWNLYCCELKIFVRCQNKEMASVAPSDGNYVDSYGHLLVNSDFIFIYLVYEKNF